MHEASRICHVWSMKPVEAMCKARRIYHVWSMKPAEAMGEAHGICHEWSMKPVEAMCTACRICHVWSMKPVRSPFGGRPSLCSTYDLHMRPTSAIESLRFPECCMSGPRLHAAQSARKQQSCVFGCARSCNSCFMNVDSASVCLWCSCMPSCSMCDPKGKDRRTAFTGSRAASRNVNKTNRRQTDNPLCIMHVLYISDACLPARAGATVVARADLSSSSKIFLHAETCVVYSRVLVCASKAQPMGRTRAVVGAMQLPGPRTDHALVKVPCYSPGVGPSVLPVLKESLMSVAVRLGNGCGEGGGETAASLRLSCFTSWPGEHVNCTCDVGCYH
eukprot:scaffold183319_cov20-Tisochrysis_lutea.AAC.2